MKYLITFLTVTCSVTFSFAQSNNDKWDLRKCVDYGMQNNISVKQADVQARLSALLLQQAKLYQYPNVAFNTGYGPQFGRSIDPTTNQYTTAPLYAQSYSVSGNFQIYNWNRLKNNVASNLFSAQAALLDVERAANDVALNVATYYLQVLAAKEQVDVSIVQIAQRKTQLEITRKQVDAGSLPELNLIQIEAQLANDSSNYITNKSTFDQSLLSLKAMLNLDAALPFDVETPAADKIPLETFAELQPELVYKLALNSQPLQKENELKIKSAEQNVLYNKAGLYPTIGANYNLGTTYNSQDIDYLSGKKLSYSSQLNDNFRQSIGIGLSIPIFNNGQARVAYEQSKLNLKNTVLQRDQANITLKQNIYTSYTNAVNALEKLNASKKNVESAQKVYDFSLKRYEVGLLGTLDLITNENNLITAKLQLVASEYDYVFKMKLLEFYKGQGLKL